MSEASEAKLLLLETSGRVGQVAVARGATLLEVRALDEARRHARDLAPAVAELLAVQKWKPRDLQAVIVSRGPGSYTGLRVGIMSAKTLAYATGCAVIGVDTFAVIARQAPATAQTMDVLADAQQDRLYVQSFERGVGEAWPAVTELAIMTAAEWLRRSTPSTWVSGPGARQVEGRLPEGAQCVPLERREPGCASLLQLGYERLRAGGSDDLWRLEPLYARPSSAEEQWPPRR